MLCFIFKSKPSIIVSFEEIKLVYYKIKSNSWKNVIATKILKINTQEKKTKRLSSEKKETKKLVKTS